MTSREHAAVDIAVALALATLAVRRGPPMLRSSAAAGAVAQAALIGLTNYDAGIVRRISFAHHRQLDVALAAALACIGFGLRSASLVGTAAVLAGSTASTGGHAANAPCMLYRPLDVPKPFAPDVWLVDGAIGPGIPVRMTVIRLSDGSLLLHSPTRHSVALQHSLERLGAIRHLVAPNSVHWTFVRGWQRAVPGVRTFGAPGLRDRAQVRRSRLRIDEDLGDEPPPCWGGAVAQAVVPGGAGFREVALFHCASKTLLMTDLMQNFELPKLPWAFRPLAWLLGILAPESRAPAHLRTLMRLRRADAARAAHRIVGWEPERIVVAHGAPIEHDAPRRLRSSLGWLL